MAADRATRRTVGDAMTPFDDQHQRIDVVGLDPTPDGDLALSFEAPRSWQPAPLPRPVTILREPRHTTGFRANVVVTSERAGPLADLATMAAGALRDARRHATAVGVTDERTASIDGVRAIVREQVVVESAGRAPLAQFVAIALLDSAGGTFRECVQITATAPLTRAAELGTVFARVLRSAAFRYGPEAG